ncbi:sodium:calcium symporter [Labedella populi]|uniref:Sodium:calcium symporter n=2 Tax=Labedella populi TaxID=2498850 RepID=A0A444QGM8_9MICO|nr:sodium:calcium symporter [Labedella populi]
MEQWPLWPSVIALAVSVGIIVIAGTPLARAADELADRTGMGEAVAGAVFLGAMTSLPGIITTATGALEGDAGFALANPVGGIALQSVWLAIADLLYRRANLEHAAASLENLLQSVILIALLGLPVIAFATPQLTVGWIHPVTVCIPILYFFGLRLLRRMHSTPMWKPTRTRETRSDESQVEYSGSIAKVWLTVGLLGALVAVTGWVIARAGLGVIAATGWSSSITGFTVTTLITSLPELIVLIAAVRSGALTLGVANIIGGNVFDVLTLTVADSFYLDGTIYTAAGDESLVLLGGTLMITAALAAGLLVRDRKGIGFEGVSIAVLYLGTIGLAIVSL